MLTNTQFFGAILGSCSRLSLPLHDGGAKAVVTDQVLVQQGIISNGAGVVTEQPDFQHLPLVCEAVHCHHRIPHHILQGTKASLSFQVF